MARRRNDFASAAFRHFRDGEYLLADTQVDRRLNADQLYGLAWECALKALMIGFGMAMVPGRPIYGQVPAWQLPPRPRGSKGDWVHADDALDRLHHHATGRAQVRYLAQLPPPSDNPFADWKVDQRYLRDGRLPGRRTVEQHRSAARQADGLLRLAILDNFIRP